MKYSKKMKEIKKFQVVELFIGYDRRCLLIQKVESDQIKGRDKSVWIKSRAQSNRIEGRIEWFRSKI